MQIIILIYLLPSFSASWAVMGNPVKHISIALDFPMLRIRRWVPPAPGIVTLITILLLELPYLLL